MIPLLMEHAGDGSLQVNKVYFTTTCVNVAGTGWHGNPYIQCTGACVARTQVRAAHVPVHVSPAPSGVRNSWGNHWIEKQMEEIQMLRGICTLGLRGLRHAGDMWRVWNNKIFLDNVCYVVASIFKRCCWCRQVRKLDFTNKYIVHFGIWRGWEVWFKIALNFHEQSKLI